MFDVIYCLLLKEDKDRAERREEFDAKLSSMTSGGVPDRATWGKLPAHQAAMRRALGDGPARPRSTGQ
jgi:hypothetical protein